MGPVAWVTSKAAGLFSDPKSLGPVGKMVTGAVPYAAPPVRGSKEMMRAAGRQPWLYAVTEKIAASLAAVPWELYVARDADGKTSGEAAKRYSRKRASIYAERLEPWQKKRAINDLRREENLERLTRHPLLSLFDSPNPAMTGFQFRKLVARNLDLTGELFGIFERNAFGKPIEIWPTPSFWCLRTPAPDYPKFQFSYNLLQREIPASEVLWLKHLDLENPYGRGIGAGFAIADVVETYEYALKTEKAFFFNHGLPAGMFSMEGADDDQLEKARINWERSYRGFWNAARLAWVGFKAKFIPFAQKFADQELQALLVAKRDTIIQAYGVPPEILGITANSNKATSMVAKGIYAEQVLTPRLEDQRAIFQQFLVPEFDESLVLDYISPIPDDRGFDLDVGKVAPNSRTLNEWRDLGNCEPWEGPEGDQLFKPAQKGGEAGGGNETGPSLALRQPARHAVVDIGAERAAGDDGISQSDISAALDAIDEAEFDPVVALFKRNVAKWGTRVFEELGVDVSFDMTNPAVDDYLALLAGERITGINDTTRAGVREALSKVYDDGGSVTDAKKALREVFAQATGDELSGGRAERIARTEVVAASNVGTAAAFKQSGVVKEKEWIHTSGQTNPREGHEAMDGQVVAIDEDFTNPDTGNSAPHPGAFGIAEEDINCGCAHWAKVADASDDDEDKALVRTKDDRAAMITGWRKAWLAEAQSGARKAFKRQMRAALAALD